MVLQRGMVLERDGFGSILTTFTFFSDGWSVRRHSEAKMMKAVLLAAAAASASAFAPAAVLPRAAKSECPATLYIIAQSLEWRLSEEGGREEGGSEGGGRERKCARLARARERDCEQEPKDWLWWNVLSLARTNAVSDAKGAKREGPNSSRRGVSWIQRSRASRGGAGEHARELTERCCSGGVGAWLRGCGASPVVGMCIRRHTPSSWRDEPGETNTVPAQTL
jgi:hypothetical protein